MALVLGSSPSSATPLTQPGTATQVAYACRLIVSMPLRGRPKVRGQIPHLLMRQIAVANGEAPGKVDIGRYFGREPKT